jgi:hypothetical protein
MEIDQMNLGGGLIRMINTRLTDNAFRDQIRAMHANQTPLVDMVVQLGLEGQMSPQVRAVVESLPAKQVAAIRRATIDMLDRAENEMPVDCDLTQDVIDGGTPVGVSVESQDRVSKIVVRAT